jgi:hypothetical protein
MRPCLRRNIECTLRSRSVPVGRGSSMLSPRERSRSRASSTLSARSRLASGVRSPMAAAVVAGAAVAAADGAGAAAKAPRSVWPCAVASSEGEAARPSMSADNGGPEGAAGSGGSSRAAPSAASAARRSARFLWTSLWSGKGGAGAARGGLRVDEYGGELWCLQDAVCGVCSDGDVRSWGRPWLRAS